VNVYKKTASFHVYKESPARNAGDSSLLPKNRCLHSHSRSAWSASATTSAILFVREDKKERRKADEQVDEILQPGHRAEKEIHDIPVAAHIVAKRDETPIEPTDYDENERNTVI